jgi:hypothetical protein
MAEINAKAVQILLTEPEDQLPRFAEHFNIPEGMVKGLRLFWSRALTGKCTSCGTPTKGAKKCRTCKRRNSSLLDPRSSVSLLREMNEHLPVHESNCSKCGGQVRWSAGHVLKRCRRFGFFRPPEPALCPSCLDKSRRKPVGLTHRPFVDLLTNGD